MQFVKRSFEMWPYLFIAISVGGLMYVVVNAVR